MKNIIVVFGGKSCEHDVSVITGVMTLNGIDKTIYNPIPVYVNKNGVWFTGEKLKDISFYKNVSFEKLERVTLSVGDKNLYLVRKGRIKKLCEIYTIVNCMHGGGGEDGSVFAYTSLCNIPCTSPSLFASSLAMDKEFTKIALKGIDEKCLACVRIKKDAFYLRRDCALKMVEKRLGYPVIIKPVTLGSSIGISFAENIQELEKGIDFALKYDNKIIVEKGLKDFTEINCAVYKKEGNTIVSELEEVKKSDEILSFADKYKTPAEKIFPAKIKKELELKIKKSSLNIYRKLGFSGVIRIDYIVKDDEYFVNEINSIPGSLAYYLFVKNTSEFKDMLTSLIEESVDEFKAKNEVEWTFDGGILNLSSAKICK